MYHALAVLLFLYGLVVLDIFLVCNCCLFHVKKKCSCVDTGSHKGPKKTTVISLGSPACVDKLAEASGHNVGDRVAPCHLSSLSPLASAAGKSPVTER